MTHTELSGSPPFNIGLADAARILADGDGDHAAAQLATDLSITAPSVLESVEKRPVELDATQTFWQELQGVLGPLKEAAERYGHESIIQLFYLQNAILENGTIISVWPTSPLATILKLLPSGSRWLGYLKRA